MQRQSYTLSTLCEQIRTAVYTHMPDTYWVRAEISSLSEKGGHAYMELAEKSTTPNANLFVAKIRATCWANVYSMLKAYFYHETGQMLQVGMQVLLEVSVEMHPVYGLSLQIHGIDPTFTIGEIAQQRQQTLLRLQEAGVIDMNKQLPFPTLPQRIAVISSADAAGYGDFCDQLTNNTYGFAFHITLFSAIVQGDRAAQSIIEALERIYAQIDKFQVVLILRGGGATTDLACFDDYSLAEACAQFPLPIVAGIGHQRDVSVVDIVANKSVKTPTAAAELLINTMAEAWTQIENYKRRLAQTLDRRILIIRHKTERMQIRLQAALMRYLQQQHDKLTFAEKHIALRSPEKIYQMGYSLTRVNGKIVRSKADVPSGTRIETILADGSITSVVE